MSGNFLGPYGMTLLIPEEKIEDRVKITEIYAAITALPAVEGAVVTEQDREYLNEARLAFSHYFVFSFWNVDRLPMSENGNRWLQAFWDIRKPDPDFGDTLIALSFRSFTNSTTRHAQKLFDAYMNDRLADGLGAADDPQRSHLTLVEKSLFRHDILRYDLTPEARQALFDEDHPHQSNH